VPPWRVQIANVASITRRCRTTGRVGDLAKTALLGRTSHLKASAESSAHRRGTQTSRDIFNEFPNRPASPACRLVVDATYVI
jgi:hypothetical protein